MSRFLRRGGPGRRGAPNPPLKDDGLAYVLIGSSDQPNKLPSRVISTGSVTTTFNLGVKAMMNRVYQSLPVPTIRELIADPSVSFWLKKALADAQNRDPLDAMRDAELLASVLRERFDSIVKGEC